MNYWQPLISVIAITFGVTVGYVLYRALTRKAPSGDTVMLFLIVVSIVDMINVYLLK